jgi:hypothetical protein
MKDGIKAKRPGYIKIYPERWIYGSTRDEMTDAQRAVWTDFLCLAYLNDPLGQIDFTTFRRLANQLNISQRLLMATIRNAMINGKIKLVRVVTDQTSGERLEDLELTCDQLDAKEAPSASGREKTGVALYSIIVLNWNSYQSEYLRQKRYRKNNSGPTENNENLAPDSVTRVTSKGEERREEEKKQNETNPPNENPSKILSPTSPLPSNSPPKKAKTIKEEFLEMLRACHSYPFSESLDSLLFDFSLKEYPGINILEQTQKKVVWWKTHEDALKADPRTQLKTWFAEEAKFNDRGGPQKIGDVMAAVDDADHRRFLGQFIERHKRSKEEEGY